MNTTKKKISFLLLFLSLLSFNLKVVFASSLEGESKDSESSQFLPSDELLKNLDTEESLSETFGSSIISRSLQSGMVVSLVLFLLIFLSVVAWAIMIEKLIYLNYVQRKSRNFLDKFWGSLFDDFVAIQILTIWGQRSGSGPQSKKIGSQPKKIGSPAQES